jgi:hypothetical protein
MISFEDVAHHYQTARARALLAARDGVLDAIVRGQDTAAAREALLEIEAKPATIEKGGEVDAVAKWPADFDPLPLYLTNPDEAKNQEDAWLEAHGLERTGPLVVDLTAAADEEEARENQAAALKALDPAAEASIIAKRESRKDLDDAAVEAFRKKTSEKETEEARLERRLGFNVATVRRLLGLG